MGIFLLLWLALSGLAQAQSERQRSYLSLAEATLRKPIRHEELRAAILSRGGVSSIRSLFERSVGESLLVEGKLVTPELGGEATLNEGNLILVPYPDPIHPILREMVGMRAEPGRLLAFLSNTADGREILQKTGGLHALLFQIANQTPTEKQLELLESVISSAVATQFKTWSADPEIQARMIETNDWRGRYVGFWHIHPPRRQDQEFTEGIEPSVQDMTNAIELGQFLTFVFQPDGFDAYDLSPLSRAPAPDLTRALVVSYRSGEWKPYFESVVRRRRPQHGAEKLVRTVRERSEPGAPPSAASESLQPERRASEASPAATALGVGPRRIDERAEDRARTRSERPLMNAAPTKGPSGGGGAPPH